MEKGNPPCGTTWNISLSGVHRRGDLELESTLNPGEMVKGLAAWEGLGRNQAGGVVTKRSGKRLQQWSQIEPALGDIHVPHECLQWTESLCLPQIHMWQS